MDNIISTTTTTTIINTDKTFRTLVQLWDMYQEFLEKFPPSHEKIKMVHEMYKTDINDFLVKLKKENTNESTEKGSKKKKKKERN